ncbi:AraC family transcriptional regulator [Galbibacter pacificus]|uniref:AraC family transcriptional regulator n=1 Tax=Galbibacter pacificus TaxID=2996052 RepID=A0ABT6FVL3_9FLAO|nr:AraC family transcriptional regulator [Galbibacter pacificus]MDG3583782.1 AraC family transcriptional regulator [Galbibacter pacificus]MDG3587300.1 AraC family transcriptional regulator [Galbibacter pacificus]
MSIKKPALEVINPTFGSSFSFIKYDENQNQNTSYWHYHPEIELVYVKGGAGKRQIGSHISYYTEGDLILIGSNLPHCGFTDKFTGNENEVVIQMLPDFLGAELMSKPEMNNISLLFKRCKGGLAFNGKTKEIIGTRIEALEKMNSFERLLGFLSILNELQLSEDYQILNAEGFSMQADVQDNDRINIVFNYVKTHFQQQITLEEIANISGMTVPSFCRYFKQITGKTFTHFVNEYRLVHASKLLAEKPIGITEICFESGFNNFSYFNKSFKKFTGKSPSQYRNELKTVIED